MIVDYSIKDYDSLDNEAEYTGKAWDCDIFFVAEPLDYDLDLDYEDDEGDWQVLALDRFGDRMVRDDF